MYIYTYININIIYIYRYIYIGIYSLLYMVNLCIIIKTINIHIDISV